MTCCCSRWTQPARVASMNRKGWDIIRSIPATLRSRISAQNPASRFTALPVLFFTYSSAAY